ncbi:MAG: phospho-N-acetylmuramoyl-pentapeptide-transferase [Mollicutes bacterium]|nr:phospho-N-acetylmuramoyl-pentapeptide-transferase [Mollicutes bacterium]
MNIYYDLFILFLVIITTAAYLVFIPLIKRKKWGQNIRTEGPRNHLRKAGTPTMGGIIIIICSIIGYLIFTRLFHFNYEIKKLMLLIIPFIGYGLVGFFDDYLIIKRHNNEGLKPSIKFILELVIAAGFYFLYLELGYENSLNFFGVSTKLSFFYGCFIVLLLTGFTNATNFTDGLDGLLGMVSLTSFIGIGILAYLKGEMLICYFTITIISVIIGFLIFNLPKAKIFMGDTGSLALGALIVSMLIVLKCEILIIFFGFIYLVEILSVMLQVWYFKRTKGQRILKMAPLHHHFELSGLSENKIDILFMLINLVMVIIGIYLGVKIF